MYSIKAIASLTGLGAETLRAWERRYQAIVPNRNASGRRFYSQQDLERLNMLADLTRQGHSIGKVSGFSDQELQLLLNSAEAKPEEHSQFNDKIVDALLDYRIDRCEQLLKRALLANEPLAYLVDILTPLLKQVGELWHNKKINVAQEHLFSACVQRILLGMVNSLQSVSANRPAMLFATPCTEPHEFGILMACLLAAEQQYNCYYLGVNVPAGDVVDAARKLKCDVVVLSLMQFPPEPKTMEDLNHIVAEVKAAIWLGGEGSQYWADQHESLPENCKILKDMNDFYIKAQRRRYE